MSEKTTKEKKPFFDIEGMKVANVRRSQGHRDGC